MSALFPPQALKRTVADFISTEKELADLHALLRRGLNTWEDAPVWLMGLSDAIEAGCVTAASNAEFVTVPRDSLKTTVDIVQLLTRSALTDSLGMPTSCGKPLCAPDEHHPLCKLHQPVERPAAQTSDLAELIRGLKGIASTTLHAIIEGSHRAHERDLVLKACEILSTLPALQQATTEPLTDDAIDTILTQCGWMRPDTMDAERMRQVREGFRSTLNMAARSGMPATPEPVGERSTVPLDALYAVERERDYWRTRARAMLDHAEGTCWYWVGDGEDHLESLVNSLPVVIRADQLRELLARPAVAQEPFGYFRAWPFGWEQCGEHDDGAVALYDLPAPGVPQGWKLSVSDSDGRKWLHIESPGGAKAALSTEATTDGGRRATIAAQVLDAFSEAQGRRP